MVSLAGTVQEGPYLVVGSVSAIYFAGVFTFGELVYNEGFGENTETLRIDENSYDMMFGYRVLLPVFMGIPCLYFLQTLMFPHIFKVGLDLMIILSWFNHLFMVIPATFADDIVLKVLSMVYFPAIDFKIWAEYPAHAILFFTKMILYLFYDIVLEKYGADAILYARWIAACPSNHCPELAKEIQRES